MLAQLDGTPLDQIGDTLEGMARALFASVPRFLLAALIVVAAWFIGRAVRQTVEPRLTGLRTPSFGKVFASLAGVGVVVAGIVIALPVAFPTVNVATLLGGLGLLTVAAGFAFQDILSNLLAGILLIFRQPFVTGDQIEVGGISGTVEGITIRETRLRTFDGRLVVIPNADVYTNPIDVQTDAEAIRSTVEVGVTYDTDLPRARRVALDALGAVEGVLDAPAPQALYTGFGASSIDLDLRYWTDPYQASVRTVQDRAVEAVKAAFDRHDIEIPFDIVTLESSDSFAQAVAGRRGRGDGQAASRVGG